jgi:hypothetical protein
METRERRGEDRGVNLVQIVQPQRILEIEHDFLLVIFLANVDEQVVHYPTLPRETEERIRLNE